MPTARMEAVDDDFVSRGQALHSLGAYDSAVNILRKAVEKSRADLQISFELCENLMNQGYYGDALQAAVEALGTEFTPDNEFLIPLQLLRCLTDAVVTARVKTNVQEAKKIYSALGDQGEFTTHVQVLATTYFCKIQKLGCDTRIISVKDLTDSMTMELVAMFDSCVISKSYGDALRVARSYSAWPNIMEPLLLSRQLAEDAIVPILIRAKVCGDIGQHLEPTMDYTECDKWDDRAASLYAECAHAHGGLDIKMRKACRLVEGEMPIENYILQYKDMNYALGLHSALLSVFSLALRLHNSKRQFDIIMEVENLALRSGAKLLGFMTRIQALARLVTMADSGKVASGAAALHAELLDTECAFLRGQAANLAAQSYLRLRDTKNALYWATQCQEAWSSCTAEDDSTAATLLLLVSLNSAEQLSELQNIIENGTVLIQNDLSQGLEENAIEKIEALINGLSAHRTEFAPVIAALIKDLQQHITKLPTDKADGRLANAYQIQANRLLVDGKLRADVQAETAALALLEEAVKLYLKQQRLWEAANTRQMGGLCHFSMYQKHSTSLVRQCVEDLNNAVRFFCCAQDAFVAIDAKYQIGEANYWIALLKYEAWTKGWVLGKEVLDSILDAEKYMDQQRNEISVLGGVDALINKQQLSANKHTRDMYRFALQVCLRESDISNAWQWVQKAKARSLSDILGLGMVIPKELRVSIDQDLKAKELFEKEEQLLHAIQRASDSDKLSLRIKLEDHRTQMAKIGPLKQLLGLREGVPVNLAALTKSSELNTYTGTDHQRKIIFADWVIKSNDIFLFVSVDGNTPCSYHLPVQLGEVHEWIKSYWNTKEGREKVTRCMNDWDNPLQELQDLIEPLMKDLSEGDLVILSPTDILHQIPLHALIFSNGELFLVRNPVVYCASLTVFAQCCNQYSGHSPSAMTKRDIVAVYEPLPDDTNFDEVERDEVYRVVQEQGAAINASRIMTGHQATPKAFTDIVSTSDILYFHGHCDTVQKSIIEQSLRLSDAEGNPDKHWPYPPKQESPLTVTVPLSMRSFFNLRMSSPVFVLMACNSATQQISTGDEPLGLITALLCAGASSVAGTLWPVESEVARIFAAEFFKQLITASQAGDGKHWIDLAVALQATCIELMRGYDTRLPEHWASFVLHGCHFSKNLGFHL